MKKKIVYTSHLEFRMIVRAIPRNLPKEIHSNANERYVDGKTGYHVAVKEVKYKGKLREMIVVYEEIIDKVKIITIHPLKRYEKEAKISIGRWSKL